MLSWANDQRTKAMIIIYMHIPGLKIYTHWIQPKMQFVLAKKKRKKKGKPWSTYERDFKKL